MKAETELSEERITKFESALRASKRSLENALQEKESLSRRIEAVESHIIGADKQRQFIMDKMKVLERTTTASEGKRKFLENKELEGDQVILQLEERLSIARARFDENSIKCEEAEMQLAQLQAEHSKTSDRRMQLQEVGQCLQSDVDQKMLQVRDIEELEMKSSSKNHHDEEELKLLESHCQEAMERTQRGRISVQKLQRLIESVQGVCIRRCSVLRRTSLVSAPPENCPLSLSKNDIFF